MGRNFRTAKPSFVDDNIYQAPWELAAKVIESKEALVDSALATADLTGSQTDNINFLDFAKEREGVEGIQKNYNDKIEALTQQIQNNPLEYNKFMPQIKQIQKEMQIDRTSGDWFHIEKRYKDFTAWQADEQNVALKKSDPDTYNRLLTQKYNNLQAARDTDPNATFDSTAGVQRLDVIDKFTKTFKTLKANATSYNDETGKYLIKDVELSEMEVANMAANMIQSDPNYQGYARQMTGLGDSGFITEDGQMTAFFNTVNPAGDIVTAEMYENMTDAEKKELRNVINQNNAYASDLEALGEAYGFRQKTATADPFALTQAKSQDAQTLASQKHTYKMQQLAYGYDRKDQAAKAAHEASLRELVLELGVDSPAGLELAALQRKKADLVYQKETRSMYNAKDIKEMGGTINELIYKVGQGVATNEETIKLEKLKGIYATAFQAAGIDDLGLQNAIQNLETEGWGYKTVSEERRVSGKFIDPKFTYINRGGQVYKITKTKQKTEERILAESLVKNNKRAIEAFDKAKTEGAAYNINVINVGDDTTEAGALMSNEFNILVANGKYDTFTNEFLPFKVTGEDNYTKSIAPGVESAGRENILSYIAGKNGVKPSQIFLPNTLKRFARADASGNTRIYYSGEINPKYIVDADPRWIEFNNANLEVEGGTDVGTTKLTFAMDESSSSINAELMQLYNGDSKMKHMYDYATDNAYTAVHDKMAFQLNEIRTNSEFTSDALVSGSAFKLPNVDGNLTIKFDKTDSTYEIYEDGVLIKNLLSQEDLRNKLYKFAAGIDKTRETLPEEEQ